MENKQPFEFNNDTNIGFTDPFAGKPLDIGGQTKTSIEWLKLKTKQIDFFVETKQITWKEYYKTKDKLYEQAKLMYQKEMEEQWNDGYMHGELGEDI